MRRKMYSTIMSGIIASFYGGRGILMNLMNLADQFTGDMSGVNLYVSVKEFTSIMVMLVAIIGLLFLRLLF